MFLLKGKKQTYGINLPTSLNELNKEVLSQIVDNVKVPNHYCIVALALKDTIFNIACNVSGKRESNLQVLPILAKIYDEDIETSHANVGDIVIIDKSSLERATHLNTNISIAGQKVSKYLKDDNELVKSIIDGTYEKDEKSTIHKSLTSINSKDVYIVEFKIVPVCDIHGSKSMDAKTNDPFKVTVK